MKNPIQEKLEETLKRYGADYSIETKGKTPKITFTKNGKTARLSFPRSPRHDSGRAIKNAVVNLKHKLELMEKDDA